MKIHLIVTKLKTSGLTDTCIEVHSGFLQHENASKELEKHKEKAQKNPYHGIPSIVSVDVLDA